MVVIESVFVLRCEKIINRIRIGAYATHIFIIIIVYQVYYGRPDILLLHFSQI